MQNFFQFCVHVWLLDCSFTKIWIKEHWKNQAIVTSFIIASSQNCFHLVYLYEVMKMWQYCVARLKWASSEVYGEQLISDPVGHPDSGWQQVTWTGHYGGRWSGDCGRVGTLLTTATIRRRNMRNWRNARAWEVDEDEGVWQNAQMFLWLIFSLFFKYV